MGTPTPRYRRLRLLLIIDLSLLAFLLLTMRWWVKW